MFKHGPMEIEQLKRVLEASIMAANTPQTLVQLNDLFGEENPPGLDSIHAAIELLQSDYAERGVALVEVASGWRFQVRPDVQPWVSRLWTERQSKYTRALLETLALIAYRQPVTRAEIEHIRGVAVSSNIIKTLEEREWIRVLGHRDVPGRPALFGTTRQFLDYFGLKSLDQLPPLADLRDLSEIEPQLELDSIAPIAQADGSVGDPTEADTAETSDGEAIADIEITSAADEMDLELAEEDAVDAPVIEDVDSIESLMDADADSSVETIVELAHPPHESIEADVASDETTPAATKDTP
jgi:segregation and condensation protein B